MASHLITTLGGQGANVSMPRQGTTSRLVVIVHGGGLDYEFAAVPPALGSQAYTRMQELIEALTTAGIAVLCPAVRDTTLTALSQGDTFGNANSTTALANAIAAAQALTGISATGKYGLIGFSAACMTMANYARLANKSNIAGMLSLEPAANISHYRGTDASHAGPSPQGIAYAACNLAYGISTDAQWNPIAAVNEPSVIAPSITFPWAFWSCSNDPFAPPTQGSLTLAGLAALIPGGKGTFRDLGLADTGINSGHNTAKVEPVDVLALLQTWAWA